MLHSFSRSLSAQETIVVKPQVYYSNDIHRLNAMTALLPLSYLSKRLAVKLECGQIPLVNQFFRGTSTIISTAALSHRHGGQETIPSTSGDDSADEDTNHKRNMSRDKDRFVICSETNRIVPSLEMARLVPLSLRESPNEVLLLLAAQSNHEACTEVLTRHVMSHDNISYAKAEKKVQEIRHVHSIALEPYAYFHLTTGSIAVLAGLASFPLVFDINTVLVFNEHFVTDDIPDAEALETVLEVGSWSWNWMEPIMGQLSFFILCMQFAYTEYNYIGLHHYHHNSKMKTAERIRQRFPQYNEMMLMNFCMSQKFFAHKPS